MQDAHALNAMAKWDVVNRTVTSVTEFGDAKMRSAVVQKSDFLDVCTKHFILHPARIGGPGACTYTLAVRRKYERGRLVVNDVWIFGGAERGNPQQCFMVPVERRNAATLLPLITAHILPGSIIHSDIDEMIGHLRGPDIW
ncbi:hypothetical protein niasHT_024721 [Heterodera trifolii]|uniref:Uncharacterized protein n=1 Tax=Heterodera trifolii TaxID=157864 RepID=A0ABD2K1B6_9BILA